MTEFTITPLFDKPFRDDFTMWEDELIFHEIEEGLLPWTFVTEQVTI